LITYVPRTTSTRQTDLKWRTGQEDLNREHSTSKASFDASARFIRHIAKPDASTLDKVEEAVRAWLAL